MKKAELSLEQILKWKGQIQAGSSLSVVTDPLTGIQYAVKTVTEYVSGFLSKLQNGEALIQGNQAIPGLRSIEGNKLVAGKYQVVTATRVLFDTSQALETDAALMALPFASVAPASFKNGQFSIAQTAECFRTSGTDATNFKASTGNSDDFRDIVPFVLRPQTTTSMNMLLVGAAAAVGSAYKIEYRAVEFLEVGKA